MSDIYLYFFLQNIKIIYSVWHWTKSLQFCQLAQFGGGLDKYEWGWTWVKNSIMSQFGERSAERLKTQNLPLLKPIDRKSKVV